MHYTSSACKKLGNYHSILTSKKLNEVKSWTDWKDNNSFCICRTEDDTGKNTTPQSCLKQANIGSSSFLEQTLLRGTCQRNQYNSPSTNIVRFTSGDGPVSHGEYQRKFLPWFQEGEWVKNDSKIAKTLYSS